MIITVNGSDFKVTKKLAKEIQKLILESQLYAYMMERDSEDETTQRIYRKLGIMRNTEWCEIEEELNK